MGPKQDWVPPIAATSTVTGEGVEGLWQAIEAHRLHLLDTGGLAGRRRRRILEEVEGMVAERLRARTAGLLDTEAQGGLVEDLVERRVDPYQAAEILLSTVSTDGRPGGEDHG